MFVVSVTLFTAIKSRPVILKHRKFDRYDEHNKKTHTHTRFIASHSNSIGTFVKNRNGNKSEPLVKYSGDRCGCVPHFGTIRGTDADVPYTV